MMTIPNQLLMLWTGSAASSDPELPATAAELSSAASGVVESVGRRLAELDDLAAHVGGTWVVAVYRGGGRYLVRTYVNTRSARRAAYRARERGQAVRVVLAELKPVWTLDLPEDEGVAE